MGETAEKEWDLHAVFPKSYLARHGGCCKNNGNDQDDFIAVSVPPRGGELRGQAVTRSYPQKSAQPTAGYLRGVRAFEISIHSTARTPSWIWARRVCELSPRVRGQAGSDLRGRATRLGPRSLATSQARAPGGQRTHGRGGGGVQATNDSQEY